VKRFRSTSQRCENGIKTVFLLCGRRMLVTANVVPSSPTLCHPDDEGAKFPRNVDSYKSHTA
jgi:hypothetical protein